MIRAPAFLRLTVRNLFVNTDPGTLVFLLGLPALYLLILGTMFVSLISSVPVGTSGISYTLFVAPGIIAIQTFTAGNIGGGMLWSDRRWGMFEQLMTGPFRRTDYLLGIMVLGVILSLGGSLIMIALSYYVTGTFILSVSNLGIILLTIILATILFSSIFLILSILVRTMQAYQTITIFLFFVLDFASTAFYPVDNSTPLPLRIFSDLNPLSFVSNVLRSSVLSDITGQTIMYLEVIIGLTIVFFLVAVALYRRIKPGT
ncbi:MAG: ABC transporter permease [Thermoplasmatales archaeon B_DKE]|nr:MAG: ABC transporter permease [Thermoplasmatales archaeon B_DKE]QRF75550.1 inner membrane transport permease [Thermoplasmatales archaeon]